MRIGSMASSLQHKCDLRNGVAQWRRIHTASATASGADGMLDTELLQVWLGQSGTMFRVNLSIFKILALIDAMFYMNNYTATMATRVDLASFFPR